MIPPVLISGFGDEASVSKSAVEQLSVMAALGLEYYSVRFVDVGQGIKNVMQLDDAELETLARLHRDYAMRVCSLGSPIGKVKLRDVDDGSSNHYVPFDGYLDGAVMRAIHLAQALDTRLIRGFSFYPPRGSDPRDHLDQAADQVAAIVDRCARHGLFFGLEVEANLVGRTGRLLAEIARRVNHPHLLLIFDAANLATQNLTTAEVIAEYRAMRPGIGWMHIKDYWMDPAPSGTDVVDEDQLKNFVPADRGDSGHEAILRDFRTILPDLDCRLRGLGLPGVFLDLEPHLKGGGQFGGFSGPDGMGVALRALGRLLDYVGIPYHLRDFDSLPGRGAARAG